MSKSPVLFSRGSSLVMFTTLFSNRYLVKQLVLQELRSKYNDTLFGSVWLIVTPVIMLSIYTFVFGYVFKARWSADIGAPIDFATVLFIGLILHGFLSENISRAPLLIVQHASYVKKLIFPLEILAWVRVFSSLLPAFVSVMVWLLLVWFTKGYVPLSALLLPILFVPLIFYCLAAVWFLSGLGTYLRDVDQISGVLSTILVFVSPIFFPISSLPAQYQMFMYLNPLTLLVIDARELGLWGNAVSLTGLAVTTGVSVMLAWLAFRWFQALRDGFSDVL